MLKNHYYIDENIQVSAFLKKINDKKISHYIILDTEPKSFVDIRTVALRIKNLKEKLKGLKKRIANSNSSKIEENLNFLIESGDRIIDTNDGFYDFIDALNSIVELEPEFLNEKIESIGKKEIYALNENDKISSARNLFLKKRINILPVIKDLKVIGELRPIDLLVGDLFETSDNKAAVWDEKSRDNILNLPISNLINSRPLIKPNTVKIKEVVKLMIDKKLPSVIITDEDENLYSIISYKDIFRYYKKDNEVESYLLEFVGGDELYPDEFDLIQDYAEKTMKKIIKISDYDNLKITFKTLGEKLSGHKKKILAKFLLSHGNSVIQVEKEIVQGTNDEEFNDRVKGNWNIPQIVQEGLAILEKKVKEEKRKK